MISTEFTEKGLLGASQNSNPTTVIVILTLKGAVGSATMTLKILQNLYKPDLFSISVVDLYSIYI